MSMTYSPSNLLLMFLHPKLDENGIIQTDDNGNILYTYDIIGNATNIVINTLRSKVPIFVFGAAEAKTISRGLQMITGQIDMVQISESLIDNYLKKQKRKVTPLEYQYNSSVYGTVSEQHSNIFGYNNGISYYEVSDTNIDDIHFDEIVLMSTDPQPTKVDNVDAIKYLMLTLYNVDFFDYSYAKTINDLLLMERVSFMAKGISPINTYTVKLTTNG